MYVSWNSWLTAAAGHYLFISFSCLNFFYVYSGQTLILCAEWRHNKHWCDRLPECKLSSPLLYCNRLHMLSFFLLSNLFLPYVFRRTFVPSWKFFCWIWMNLVSCKDHWFVLFSGLSWRYFKDIFLWWREWIHKAACKGVDFFNYLRNDETFWLFSLLLEW